MKAAVFLDRDGTIIEDVGYLVRLDQIAFFPWSVDAIRAFNQAGLTVVVITNQSAVARGYITEAFVDETHRAIDARLEAGGARIDAYYHCPHHPDGTIDSYARVCECRKPASGMIDRAVRDLELDPARSFFVGDTWLDVGAGRAAGTRTILIRRQPGAREAPPPADLSADVIVDNLAAAASWILMTRESETLTSEL